MVELGERRLADTVARISYYILQSVNDGRYFESLRRARKTTPLPRKTTSLTRKTTPLTNKAIPAFFH